MARTATHHTHPHTHTQAHTHTYIHIYLYIYIYELVEGSLPVAKRAATMENFAVAVVVSLVVFSFVLDF